MHPLRPHRLASPPRLLTMVGLAGNALAAAVWTLQGNPWAALFAAGAIINIFMLWGGRNPDPLSEIPIPTREELREARRAERTALHDEWDAEFRRLTPPTKGGPIWERRPYRKDTP